MQTTVASDATHYRLSGSRPDLALADERCTIHINTKPRIARGLCDAKSLGGGSHQLMQAQFYFTEPRCQPSPARTPHPSRAVEVTGSARDVAGYCGDGSETA